MTKLRNIVAIIACKLLIRLGVLMGKKGSSMPGSIAMKISPEILKTLSGQIKKEIILVCGTNGKTTTNNLIYSLLSHDGSKVVCNNVGANMLPGVACAFIAKANIWGKLDASYAAIECDEASVRHIVKHLTPHKIVITNLFRDQMDRYGEIEGTVKLLNEAIEKVPDTTLILNADDPFTRQFGEGRKAVYYGVSESALSPADAEIPLCPKCQNRLSYEYSHYNQLGKYKCGCGFERPNPHYSATRVDMQNSLKFVLSFGGEQHKMDVNYRGFYNVYNILASFSVFHQASGMVEDAIKVFDEYKPQLGRMEPFTVGGKTVILNLAKNPAGFNQALSTINDDKRTKNVLIAVNDMPSDGTDISWLWDTQFESLCDENIKNVYVSGTRMYDTALRLKYAGVENTKLIEINADTLKEFIAESGDICYIVVNYTVLFAAQNILRELEDK